MVPKLEINAQTSGEDVRLFFAENQPTGVLQMSRAMTADDLVAIVQRFAHEDARDRVYDCVAAHESATDAILLLVVKLASEVDVVASSVATAGRASRRVLGHLLTLGEQEVSDHANLALIVLELETATPERFEEIYELHVGDGGTALGVRHCLAAHERTPVNLLAKLASDEADFIAATARQRQSFDPE